MSQPIISGRLSNFFNRLSVGVAGTTAVPTTTSVTISSVGAIFLLYIFSPVKVAGFVLFHFPLTTYYIH